MRIVLNRRLLSQALYRQTYQDKFPDQLICECGHRMLPVFSFTDEEGILAECRPDELTAEEFWFHDSVALVVYLCVDPRCGKMKATWNQA